MRAHNSGCESTVPYVRIDDSGLVRAVTSNFKFHNLPSADAFGVRGGIIGVISTRVSLFLYTMSPCAACARAGAGSLCGSCLSAAYCDAGCQRAHWAKHKVVCKAIAADAARGSGSITACSACARAFDGEKERPCPRCDSAMYCNAACERAHFAREHGAVCAAVARAAFARVMARATAGDAKAMKAVGSAYKFGTGVAADLRKMFEWYVRAAEAGHAVSAQLVGECFEHGEGVDVEPRKAF